MNSKIHPHNECGICSKPRDYKRETRDRETLKEAFMPYYPTIDEDLKRAKEILAKGKGEPLELGGFDYPEGVSFQGGTIYGADLYAAYKLLESFVEHITFCHQQADAGHNHIDQLEAANRHAIALNKKADTKIRALEDQLEAATKRADGYRKVMFEIVNCIEEAPLRNSPDPENIFGRATRLAADYRELKARMEGLEK